MAKGTRAKSGQVAKGSKGGSLRAKPGFRIEKDSMGPMLVPEDALYAASTARGVENFPVSGEPLPREFLRAVGLTKLAAARVNHKLGGLSTKQATVIEQAAQEVVDGTLDIHFPLDVFQTGSMTSTNMNANEVIANRAIELLGGERGSKAIHANDHVNMGQSSNDMMPGAMHVAAVLVITERLQPALKRVQRALNAKAREFEEVVKIGRTHLMDATPVTLGQEFGGYASQMGHGIAHIEATLPHMRELAIGGTAVGTGLNTHPKFGRMVASELTRLTGQRFVEAPDHFEAQAAQDAYVATHGAFKTVAGSLMKIANDIRLLGSGPRCGIGELALPATQPGSSIMPGKVNPVICESVIQVGAQVYGNDVAVGLGSQWGQLDLNVMLPMMTRNFLDSAHLLANVSNLFVDKCITGLEANIDHCEGLIEGSLAMVTALNPKIGYDASAEIAKEAFSTGVTVRSLVVKKKLLTAKQAAKILDPRTMLAPKA